MHSYSALDALFETKLEKYAELIIKSGCNIQPGQDLLVSISIENADFARLLTKHAYKQGARLVTVRYGDEKISRLHYDNCALEIFEDFPEWQALLNNSMADAGAAVLSITSSDPKALEGVDQSKLVAGARASHKACKNFYDAIDQGRLVWCIAGAAAPDWAKQVFPDLPPTEAISKLWDAIFETVRIGEPDPIQAWKDHRASFNARKQWLAEQNFVELHYTNSLGTDLVVGLNEGGLWQGGGDITVGGVEFFPNMPTEEIFTTPNRLKADGIVYSSMPLVHNGSLVEDFSITFKEGRAVACEAKKGQEVLEAIFSIDDGAAHLGECALVSWASPIRRSGVLFYNTLFDENAKCHLAVGQGFPDCLEGGQDMDEDELLASGVSKSASHVDFMIGTPDLSIDGVQACGTKVTIFKNGDWAC